MVCVLLKGEHPKWSESSSIEPSSSRPSLKTIPESELVSESDKLLPRVRDSLVNTGASVEPLGSMIWEYSCDNVPRFDIGLYIASLVPGLMLSRINSVKQGEDAQLLSLKRYATSLRSSNGSETGWLCILSSCITDFFSIMSSFLSESLKQKGLCEWYFFQKQMQYKPDNIVITRSNSL